MSSRATLAPEDLARLACGFIASAYGAFVAVNRKLQAILLVALAFAGGHLLGSRRTSGDAPARDQAVKVVTIKRTVDNAPDARDPVETHRLRVYRVSTGDAPTPPDGTKHEGIWVISLTDDTITGNLTGTHYYAVPE